MLSPLMPIFADFAILFDAFSIFRRRLPLADADAIFPADISSSRFATPPFSLIIFACRYFLHASS